MAEGQDIIQMSDEYPPSFGCVAYAKCLPSSRLKHHPCRKNLPRLYNLEESKINSNEPFVRGVPHHGQSKSGRTNSVRISHLLLVGCQLLHILTIMLYIVCECSSTVCGIKCSLSYGAQDRYIVTRV